MAEPGQVRADLLDDRSERPLEHQRLGPGVLEDVAQLVGHVPVVDVDRRHPGLERTDHRLDPLGAVPGVDRDAGVLAEAATRSGGGRTGWSARRARGRSAACRRRRARCARAPRRRSSRTGPRCCSAARPIRLLAFATSMSGPHHWRQFQLSSMRRSVRSSGSWSGQPSALTADQFDEPIHLFPLFGHERVGLLALFVDQADQPVAHVPGERVPDPDDRAHHPDPDEEPAGDDQTAGSPRTASR